MLKNRVSNIELLRANLLSKEEKKKILEYWGFKLGLNQIPIQVHFLEEDNFPEKHGSLGFTGVHNGKIGIALTKEANSYIIIHELGHIYFNKHINQLYHEGTSKKYWNYEIYSFNNGIMDSFTNYHLYKFDSIHTFPQFRNSYLKDINNTWFISPKISFANSLEFYIKIYLCYNFILSKEDKGKLLDCNFNLKRTKSILRKKGEDYYKKPLKEKLDLLDNHLNYFDKIKDTKDYNQVRYFIMKGLKILDLWPQEVLSQNLKLLFKD